MSAVDVIETPLRDVVALWELGSDYEPGRCSGCGKTGPVVKMNIHTVDCPDWQKLPREAQLSPREAWARDKADRQAQPEIVGGDHGEDVPTPAEPESVPDVGTGDVEPVVEGTPVPDLKVEARDRAGRIRAGIDGYATMCTDLAEAIRYEDWKTLGYASLPEYFEGEEIAERWKASETNRAALVLALADAGLTQGNVADLLHISQQRVSQIERGKTGHAPNRSQRAETRPDQHKQASNDLEGPASSADASTDRGSAPGGPDSASAPTDQAERHDDSDGAGEPAGGTSEDPAALQARIGDLERELAEARERIDELTRRLHDSENLVKSLQRQPDAEPAPAADSVPAFAGDWLTDLPEKTGDEPDPFPFA
jgi:transcriptional regulator with XRE-family HTH domain